MAALITTLGPLDAQRAGIVLPHEHVFVDLRTPDHPDHGRAEAAEVAAVMTPELRRAARAGIGAIVEASTVGVGRRADILAEVSLAAGLPLLAPTGCYREPWIPRWIHDAAEDWLEHWMTDELTRGIGSTGVRAGWIKLSAGDDGLTACETKVLRAAVRAALQTGAVIGSHTIRGRVVLDQLAILEKAGLAAQRFIWIHTQAEPDRGLHWEVARRGAWIEYDAIGATEPDAHYVQLVLEALGAGFEEKVLLSQDRGWYDPAKPRGGEQRAYTHLVLEFLPRLAEAGVPEQTLNRLTRTNPFQAFAR